MVIPTRARSISLRLLLVLCAPMFLVLLDVLAMNVAMPTLGQRFDIAARDWSHVVDAYTVPLALALLPAGWFVDRFGSRRCLLVSLAAFASASTAGALAPSWTAVLAARGAQGVAAAVMLPAGLAALSLATDDDAERSRVLGFWSAISAVATAIGPGVGGLLVQFSGWESVFWINVPVTVLAFCGAVVLVQDHRSPRQHGAIGRPRALAASVAAAGVMTSGANGALTVITIVLHGPYRLSAGTAGAVLLLATVPFAVLGPITGSLITRYGRRIVAASGFMFGAAGFLFLGRLGGVSGLVPSLIGIGVGLGLMTAAIVGESLASWPTRPGVASGLNNALRQAGTSLGVFVGGLLASHDTSARMLTHAGLLTAMWWCGGTAICLTGFAATSRRRGWKDGKAASV